MYTENRLSIVQVGGLLPLGSAAQVMDLEIQREVAACLCHVSLSDENKVPIVISNAIKPMLMLCQSADVEVARLACGAAANIAEDPMTHRPLVYKVNAMHTLCYLMRSKHMSVHREASRAVSNLLGLGRFGGEGDHGAFGLEQEGVLLRFVHNRVERQAVVSQPLLTALDHLPTKPLNRKRTGAANPGFGAGFRVKFWGGGAPPTNSCFSLKINKNKWVN